MHAGHKTGFYIDQRDNRRLVQDLATRLARDAGRAPCALNCFCYTGAFSLAAHRGGGGETWSIDSSADALAVESKLDSGCGRTLEWRCNAVWSSAANRLGWVRAGAEDKP